jgi:hypothetical protein
VPLVFARDLYIPESLVTIPLQRASYCIALSHNFPLVFLSLPQASVIVHSFCTSAKCFSIAMRDPLLHSGFTEYVDFSGLAKR